MQRKILRAIIRLLLKLLTRFEVTGVENVPLKGAYLLATNHLNYLDSAIIVSQIEREDVTALAADKYKHNPLFRWFVNAFDGIWINREEADLNAMRASSDYLRTGGIVGIAPEGTRSRTGGLIPAKTGVAYLADKAKVPVILCALSGTEKITRELLHLRRPRLKLQFGKPLELPPIERSDRDAALQRNTDEIMCQIAAMLPPQYRGVYADHPRLKELLATQV